MNLLPRWVCLGIIAPLTASPASAVVLADGTDIRTAIYVPDHAIDGPGPEQVNWYDDDTSEDHACTEAFLARELAQFLARLAEAEPDAVDILPLSKLEAMDGPPVRLVVGHAESLHECSEDDWFTGSESYAIYPIEQSNFSTIVLSGVDTAGTVYAAYEFLGRLGCRWYAPGTDGEVVPKRERIEWSDEPYLGRPALRKRGGTALASSPDMILWAARNKLHATFYTDLHRFPMAKMLGFIDFDGGHLSWKMLNPTEAYPFTGDDNPYPFVEDPATGVTGGRDRDADGALSYYEAHPEWFGYDAARNVRDVWHPDEPRGLTILRNFCISNDAARDMWIHNALKDIASRPYLDTIYVDLNDTPRFCECEICAAKTPSDWNLQLMRDLARTVAHAGFDTKVGINFYTFTRTDQPPTVPLDLSESDYDRLEASYSPIRRCYAHAINDEECYEPLSPAECNRATAIFFSSWREAGFRDKYMIVDYLNRGPWCWTPALVANRIVEDYRIYRDELDVIEGWMAFGIRPPFGAKLWDYYIFAKLCDKGMEAQATYLELKRAFFDDYFGASRADAVEAAFDAARDAFKNISYFHNRPHAAFEGILAQSRPGMIREAALDGATGPWSSGVNDVGDLFPFEHLAYTSKPDTGANSVDIEEMRPLLANLKARIDSVRFGDDDRIYARRWSEVRAHLLHGYYLAELIIALVDGAKADLEAADPEPAAARVSECVDALKSDVVQPFGGMNQGPWMMALYDTMQKHSGAYEALMTKYPDLREPPRVPGPPPAPPQPTP